MGTALGAGITVFLGYFTYSIQLKKKQEIEEKTKLYMELIEKLRVFFDINTDLEDFTEYYSKSWLYASPKALIILRKIIDTHIKK